jgi:hypothetical protein
MQRLLDADSNLLVTHEGQQLQQLDTMHTSSSIQSQLTWLTCCAAAAWFMAAVC